MIKSYGNSHTLSRLSYRHKICVKNKIVGILTKPGKLRDTPHSVHESKKKKLRIALIASFFTMSSKEAPRTRSEIRRSVPSATRLITTLDATAELQKCGILQVLL